MEKPQELINTEERIRLLQEYIDALKRSQQMLADGERKLKEMTEVLRQSNEDVQVLLAFIKSKGLQPPTIQSKFIN